MLSAGKMSTTIPSPLGPWCKVHRRRFDHGTIWESNELIRELDLVVLTHHARMLAST